MILYTEGKNEAQMSEAEKVVGILTACYPGHPWAARVDDGLIFIRYLDPNLSGNWGMVLKTKDVEHDAAVMKKKIVMLAGEWLERAGLKRGRNNDDEIQHVDGLPDKHQPNYVSQVNFEHVIQEDQNPLRTEIRPQALNG